MPSVRGFIEGDNNILYEDGIITSRMNTTATPSGTENFANTDLTFDANRTHDTAGYNLRIVTDSLGNESFLEMTSSSCFLKYNGRGVAMDSEGSNFAGALIHTVTNVSGTHTADNDDYIINCTANTFTVNLPAVGGLAGRTYTIKNSGSGVITVDGDGTETIDGSLTISLSQWDSITVVSDGANWIVTNYSTTSGSYNGFNNEFLTMGA
jgi:hypothetical protein